MIPEALATRLQAAGLRSIVMGVESGSEVVRREVLNRKESNETILRTAEMLHRVGLQVCYDFILDLPWKTEENCRGTFELVRQLPRPLEVGLHSLTFLPRTALTQRALAEGLIEPRQIGAMDRPLAERFESFRWKYRLESRNRRATFWHSLIYLASTPHLSPKRLSLLYKMRFLLRLYPQPLVFMAEAVRLKLATGETRLFEGPGSRPPPPRRLPRPPSRPGAHR